MTREDAVESSRGPDATAVKTGARFAVAGPLAPGAEVALPEAIAHHATRVLRLAVGDAVVLFDGAGGEFSATLVHASKNGVRARVGRFAAVSRESPLAVELVQGLSSGDRMDWTVAKAVELGASAITPVATARSVVKLAGDRAERRREHWAALVASSAAQSGRTALPPVAEPRPLRDWLAALPADPAGTLRLMLAPGAPRALATLARPPGGVTLLVGPEGGFTADETAAAAARGFVAIRLGPRILRTETAAMVALAALQARWGDLDGGADMPA
ncbi:MAG: 16S rRNA (uracil(1498)-N(3))-methyltransferase [Burkholderiales bacterium]|jgi:16S rRNA (uracil1498-N3)-methyltransferase|nr:16S rRNA (uracil(1498)-N(3))-methyltransferase [Burkholderiales bacterium]